MRLAIVIVALALAGCGSRKELQPPPGQALPVAPYGADATPTADQLLRPSVEARPARSDEVLRDSVERKNDEFDLPPN